MDPVSESVTPGEAASTLLRVIVRWTDIALNVATPIGAVAILVGIHLFGWTLTEADLLQLVLLVLGLLAIRASLERSGVLRSIEATTQKTAAHTQRIADGQRLELLAAAADAGVVALYPRASEAIYADCANEIRRSKGHIFLCGVALKTFCDSQVVRAALREHSRVYESRVLLLDPTCDEAKRRAKIESPLGRNTIRHIESNRDWFVSLAADNCNVRVQLYALPPIVLLVMTDQFVYVEPYHFGRPDGLEDCIGGHVPVMKIRNRPELDAQNAYAVFEAHFDYLWDETARSQVHLSIRASEVVASSHVVLHNETEKTLAIGGWTLGGRGSHSPFVFPDGYVWKHGGALVVSSSRQNVPGQGELLHADMGFMGDNRVVTLQNTAGVEIAEFPVAPPPSTVLGSA